MTGFLLALVFAGGVALLWAAAIDADVALPRPDARLRKQLDEAGVPIAVSALVAAITVAAAVGFALTWSLVEVPVLAFAAACGSGYVPIAWLRRRRERRLRERERAWPAALAQLADALEAGLAFPAAVALVAESGPERLRAELTAFHTRLRAGGSAAAIDGLASCGERTADTVALLLRASVLELPAGGLAPVLRELSQVLSERFEAREKARSRAASLQLEAAILALSPIVLLLLAGAASPGYLDAYRTGAGSLVTLVSGAAIFGLYLLMRRLGRVPAPRRMGAGR